MSWSYEDPRPCQVLSHMYTHMCTLTHAGTCPHPKLIPTEGLLPVRRRHQPSHTQSPDGKDGLGRGSWWKAKFAFLMMGGITSKKPYSKEIQNAQLIPANQPPRMNAFDQ